MDFSRKRVRKLKAEEGELAELYPHDLQMYTLPPTCEISLTEFEQLPVDRLKVLRIIEQINSLGHAKSSDEWRKAVADEIKKRPELKIWYKLITSSGAASRDPDYAARKTDHISHFILRLAFCRSEEQRRWLISRELDLFRLRWLNLSSEGRSSFIKLNNLEYDAISSSERLELADKSVGFVSTSTEYYRVPFTLVLDLVRSRKVHLASGYAYIASADIISVLVTVVRTRLAQELARTAQRLPHVEYLEEDQARLFRPLRALPNSYIGEDYSTQRAGNRVPIESIDALAAQSFPLCMRQLHSRLRTDHKLRHHGRLQYALFLKGIGVTLEDVVTMWRNEWAKVEPEKFEKGGVSYLLRHCYGKEGKRTNYTPHSCVKICNTSVGPGDQHGCPFKHNDVASIRLTVSQTGASPADIQETVDLIGRSQYGLACTKYFELTHKALPERIINHPVQYFEESMNLKSGKADVKKEFSGSKTTGPSTAAPKAEDDLWGDLADDELMNVDAV